MARSCAICGKESMGGFNPQSSGMNRVRAHRRMQPNLQPLVIHAEGRARRRRSSARAAGAPSSSRPSSRRRRRAGRLRTRTRPAVPDGRFVMSGYGRRVEPDRERAVVDELDLHLGAEPAGLHVDPQSSQRRDELADRALGQLRRRGAREPGPTAAARVGVQRELRDRPAPRRRCRAASGWSGPPRRGRSAARRPGGRGRPRLRPCRPGRRRAGRPGPCPIDPTTSPSTRTSPRVARWSSALTAWLGGAIGDLARG